MHTKTAIWVDTMEKEGIKLISQRAYPRHEFVKEYVAAIENISDTELRIALKLLACTGLRVGELFNSYLYLDENKRLIIRALAEKIYTKRKGEQGHVALHKMPSRGFLGAPYLISLLSEPIWRSKVVRLQHYPDLKVAELYDLASNSVVEPEWIGLRIKNTYHRLYVALKTKFSVPISYRISQREIPFTANFKPSFHFFRKLYSAQLTHLIQADSPAQAITKVVDDMQWDNADMLLTYVKDY